MNTVDLSNQLAALSDSLKTTNLLISRLSKLTFQPGSEPLEGDTGVRVEISQDIHDSLKQLEEELEFLKQEADDYKERISQRRRRDSRAAEEVRITAKVVKLGEELAHSRQQFRNAQIAAKFASEQAKRQEREALLEGYRREAEQLAAEEGATTNGSIGGDAREQLFARRRGHQQQKQLTKDEILVNASSDVTSALRRTHALLSTELERSRFAQETFDESTTALKQLGEEYSNLDNILSNSRNLLSTLVRSQKSDTWYLETAFYVLVTTLIWLVFRRILYGPFIKLPLFLVNTLIFLANWVFLKPLFFLLTLVGVITTEPANPNAVTYTASSSTRAPLIVKPSAQGRASPIPDDIKRNAVPAGAGGAGAKVQDPILQGKVSEHIGKMAEESAKQNEQPVKRGDGTVLQERGDVPKNPKKKNFEADAEDKKHEEAQQQEEQKQRQKRDEL
ncbi:Protein transport protein sec20 [Pseudocercospora fuligena]|uniref:Protein transport protein sec20 n=1 Tax=Pseudocercospora fuligena TaxID=685502 RepID=A0A8H6VNS1_9PEZI|nr:Protein transport protein sec20 [Pseudocercospora fuligena]